MDMQTNSRHKTSLDFKMPKDIITWQVALVETQVGVEDSLQAHSTAKPTTVSETSKKLAAVLLY
jgi:hypothetical protein